MNKSPINTQQWFNPFTKVIIYSIIFYIVIGILLFGKEALYYGKVIETMSDYMLVLLYPITVPINSVTLYYQRLEDPYTGHVWGWTVFYCAFLTIAIIVITVASIVSTNNTIKKISTRVGIPLIVIWIIGAFLYILGNSIH